ncbi:MAG: hypothetical protein ACRC80_19960 [Waterburya sp.]
MGLLTFLRQVWATPPRHSINHSRAYSGAKRGRLHGDWQAVGTSANAEVYGGLFLG